MKTPLPKTRRPDLNPFRRRFRGLSQHAWGLLRVPLLATLAVPAEAAYTVPNISDLLFNVNTDALVGAAGAATGSWTTGNPAAGFLTSSGGSPTNDVINGVKWEKNNGAAGDMYRFPGPGETGASPLAAPAWDTNNPIVCSGATIVAAIKPLRYLDGGNWNSIVDLFYDGFVLAIDNQNGQIDVKIKGADYWTGIFIPDQQTTVLSVVANAAGGFTLYANGASAYVNATAAAMTSLVPGGSGNTSYKHYVNVGRNEPDGWPCFNGNIGDVLVYKTALGAAQRAALEADLMAKFHAGASYPATTLTASADTGATISPSGVQSVPYEADTTFAIAALYGYSVDVLVDGVSQGNISSYTFTDVIANHSIEVVGTPLDSRTISGNVSANPGGGATVSVKVTGSSLPSQQTTTDGSGNYTMTVPNGALSICASQTGCMISPDTVCNASGDQVINFSLTAGRNIPQMENLLFAADSSSLGTVGTAGNWNPLLYSTYPGVSQLSFIASPTVTKVRGIKYDYNLRTDGDGYRLNTSVAPAAIPATGATVVTVVKPVRNTTGDGWNSVVDIFRDNLVLGVYNGGGNAGKVYVDRNGATFISTGIIPDGQLTLLSLVVQPDGTWKVWASAWNATTNQFDPASVFFSSALTSAFTAFVPAQFGPDDWRKYINIGRNNGDGWSSFNGYIGDTFVYKTALSDADRATLEADINLKTTSLPTYNITATAGAGGSISPPGDTAVGETDSQSYTITPAFGYDIADVVVDNASVGASPTYTFSNVTATHTIASSFVVKPTQVVTGRVLDSVTLGGLPYAMVYFSASANASVSPNYVVTADAGGNYTANVFDNAWKVCASHDTHATGADSTVTVAGAPVSGQILTLVANGRDIPAKDQLLFSVLSGSLTAGQDAATGPWAIDHPLGMPALTSIGTPTVDMLDGAPWVRNQRGPGGDDGFAVATYAADIPVQGVTIVAAVKPSYNNPPVDGEIRGEIVDIFYSDLFLAVSHNDGQVLVCNRGYQDTPTGYFIPDGQKTILSLVVQPAGAMTLFANGVQKWTRNSGIDYTYLHPTGFNAINIGRNAPDGWSAYNGDIGDVFLYKISLTDAERGILENDLAARFGIALASTVMNYTTWATTKYPGFDLSNPAADLDGDGMSNFEEFAFGLNPTLGSSANPIKVPLDKASGTFSYTRTASSGLAYAVQTSTDLATWTPDAGASASQTVTATSGGVETVQVTLTATPLNGRLFVRVSAQ